MTNPAPNLILEALRQRREQALRRLAHAQALAREAAELERKVKHELQELETTQRVLQGLSSSPERPEDADFKAPLRHIMRRVREADALAEANMQQLQERLHADARLTRKQMMDGAAELLADGKWLHTEELLAMLAAKGLVLHVANPQTRLSQMLGSDERFQTQRGRGWSLKNTPSLSGDPHFDEPLRRRAARLSEVPARRPGEEPGT